MELVKRTFGGCLFCLLDNKSVYFLSQEVQEVGKLLGSRSLSSLCQLSTMHDLLRSLETVLSFPDKLAFLILCFSN